MLVLDAEDLARFTSSGLSQVESLTKSEAATLYQAWEHAVKKEALEWIYVADVYVSTEGFFYFYSEKGMKSDFNIFTYIDGKCSSLPGKLNSLTAKAILGTGKGLPEHPLGYTPPVAAPRFPDTNPIQRVPEFAAVGGSTFADIPGPVWDEGVSQGVPQHYEDDESTGILNEDDVPQQMVGTAYELSLEGSNEKFFIGRREYTVGRSESANWRILGNKSISRLHAKIWVNEEDKLIVMDTGSSNGVFVDAVRIGSSPVDVSNSSVIMFGNARVRNLGERQVAY